MFETTLMTKLILKVGEIVLIENVEFLYKALLEDLFHMKC
jgi:hypothetical protein